ncbi:MAG: glycosyl hydrolase 115 family protein, partial [Bacteroidaceae bacterium]|nr:glycosyl hydrolase 115 family protein [Bacteroidaceae bacterium]
GVSPWVYFADVKPAHKDEIIFDESIECVSKEPSVKYRGFFINDEWPAFGNWTFKNFGGFTAEMYDHVFELILRLKGNYLWPAMWTSSFSLDGPGLENARLADEYGIVMSNSHHEPCLRHSEEWDIVRGEDSIYGNDWNFDKNREGLIRYWADALDRNGDFENIITIGMRGERDSEILGRTATLKDNIDYLKSVITEQNKLIKEHINEDLTQVPRMLALYKEVEAYYYGDKETEGLENWEELEGVTLMLCDDNFANTRTLPTRKKKNRAGGWGLYYHFDYHGDPVSYEWVNSTNLSKVWEQLTGAYEFGIRDIWIVNVGDLKPQELPLTYFMDLAYDYEKYGITNPNSTDQYMADWTEKCFGSFFDKRDLKSITKLLDQYTWYNNIRRPESIMPDTFHPTNYGESDAMLEMTDGMIKTAKRLLKKLTAAGFGPDDEIYSAFYQLVYYPVTASANVFRIALLGGKNHLYAKQGRVTANAIAGEIKKAIAWDKELSDNYHKLMQGKWYG